MNLSPEYTAGLFDGEGSLSINICRRYGHPPYPSGIVLRISQKANNPILQILKEAYGGNIHRQDWTLTNHKALAFMNLIYQYVIIKREPMDICFAFAKLMSTRGENLSPRVRSILTAESHEERWKLKEQLIKCNKT